jgi:hypothetical protein
MSVLGLKDHKAFISGSALRKIAISRAAGVVSFPALPLSVLSRYGPRSPYRHSRYIVEPPTLFPHASFYCKLL